LGSTHHLHHFLYGLRSVCGLVLTLVSIHWWKGLNS
jgi:hypothetical protein